MTEVSYLWKVFEFNRRYFL